MCKKQTNKEFFNEAKSYQNLKATPPENLMALEPKKGPEWKRKTSIHTYKSSISEFQPSEPTKKHFSQLTNPVIRLRFGTASCVQLGQHRGPGFLAVSSPFEKAKRRA